MTILVDAAIWPWRGQKWAHLVSDTSYQELHDFATGIGKKRVSFQGDHYDVTADDRDVALEAGAAIVDSRQLVRALRSSGLRRRPSDPPIDWEWDVKSTVESLRDLPVVLERFCRTSPGRAAVLAARSVGAAAGLKPGPIAVTTLRGSSDLALILTAPAVQWTRHPDVTAIDAHEAYVSRSDGSVSIEILTGPGTKR